MRMRQQLVKLIYNKVQFFLPVTGQFAQGQFAQGQFTQKM